MPKTEITLTTDYSKGIHEKPLTIFIVLLEVQIFMDLQLLGIYIMLF